MQNRFNSGKEPAVLWAEAGHGASRRATRDIILKKKEERKEKCLNVGDAAGNLNAEVLNPPALFTHFAKSA